MLGWLKRRRETRRLVQVAAESLLRDYGADDARLVARVRARNARDRQRAAHWRRVARAVARMTGKIVDY
jgi:hypothetical protein